MSVEPPESTTPGEPSTEGPSLGWAIHLCGAVIAGSAALPITPDGRTFLDLLRSEFARGLLEGCLMLAGFGSPFLFGLAIAVVAAPQLRSVATELIRAPIGLMHGQLLLVAFVVWRGGEAIGAAALMGLAVVGAIAYVRSGARAPGSQGRAPIELVRWGATMLAGVAAWCKLQHIAEVRFGIALDVILGAALLIVLLSTRRSPGPPAHRSGAATTSDPAVD